MLQYITHYNVNYDYIEGAELALKGGCQWVQLRMKKATDEEFLSVAQALQPLCKYYNATFLLDDRVNLVVEANADGVHLGRNDMPVDEARRILGQNRIIGGTANTMDDVERLWLQGVDYIGCGPYRFTTTKEKLSPVLGIEGYRYICSEMADRNINVPIVAIGGILPADVPELMRTGIDGIAVSGAILNADNPIKTTKQFIKLLK